MEPLLQNLLGKCLGPLAPELNPLSRTLDLATLLPHQVFISVYMLISVYVLHFVCKFCIRILLDKIVFISYVLIII